MKWLRRLVLVAPAVGSVVLAWRCYPDALSVWLGLLCAGLWMWDAAKRIKEVESE